MPTWRIEWKRGCCMGTKLSGGAAVLALVLAAGVKTLFSACGPKPDGTWMRCHTVEEYVFLLAVALVVMSVGALLLRKPHTRRVLALMGAATAAVAALLPNVLLPLCLKTTMHCHAMMTPFVRGVGGFLAFVLLLVAMFPGDGDDRR